jgi:PAS domain S-box-containing protein
MSNESPDLLLLIVDSETKASRLIKALDPEGYQFEVIHTLEDTLLHYSGKQPALAILWFSYSSPDALDNLAALIRSLRNLGEQMELPVLLIVDQEGTQFIEPGFKLGVADILSRPIHPLVLRHRVKLILQARRTEQAEERFRTVADFTYDWEYWKGTDGRLLYNSPACQRITGYPPQRFLEQADWLLRIVHPADREMMLRHFKEEEDNQKVYSVDFRILTGNNEERWIGHVCQPVYSKTNTFIGRRVSNRDISDRKIAEESMVRSERLATIGKLTASLAHEINNPLQAMFSSVELLTQFSLEPEEQKKYLHITYTELERLMKITRGILDFSRPGLGKPELTPLKTVVEQALFLASNQMHTAGVIFKLDFLPELVPVLIVPDQIKQVCLNLIINALEHMTEGGTLTIRAWQLGNHQRVSFTDTGSGISLADLNKIFDPFFSTKDGGTGLGLAISQEIMYRHHGRIKAESVLGKGATFTLDLPVNQDEEGDRNEWVI